MSSATKSSSVAFSAPSRPWKTPPVPATILSFEVRSEGRGHFNAPGGVTESADAFSPAWCPVAEPVVESGRPELSAITRQEGALTQPGPEVPGLRIGDHDALIPRRAQPFSHEILEPQRLRPGDLDRGVHRSGERGVTHRGGDIVSRHRLNQHRRNPHRVAVTRLVGHTGGELEELRRVD